MIQHKIAETALEIGLQVKQQGLFVDRGIDRREEYRLTSPEENDLLQLYLGFIIGKESFTDDALKIVVVERTDAANDTYSLRVMTDLDAHAYESPFDALVLRDLEQTPQQGRSLVLVTRAVTPHQVERILHPDRYLHGPMVYEEDNYFVA